MTKDQHQKREFRHAQWEMRKHCRWLAGFYISLGLAVWHMIRYGE